MANPPARAAANPPAGKWKELRTHVWRDVNGRVLFEHRKVADPDGRETWSYRHPVRGRVCREHPESKPIRGWCSKKPAIAAEAMWRIGDLLDAVCSGGSIAWVAGEKDAEALRALGEYDAVTTVHQGESADVYPEQFEYFRDFGGQITVVCDDDTTGWANGVARAVGLDGVGVPEGAIWLLLPAEGSNDVSDHLTDADARLSGFRPVSLGELKARVRSASRAKAGEGPTASAAKLRAFEDALEAYGARRGTGQDWTCPHPQHDDTHPSFGVGILNNGGLGLNCQTCMPRSGTDAHSDWIDDILDELGLTREAIAPPKRKKRGSSGGGGKENETVSDRLLKIAFEEYTLGMNDEGKPFAYRNGGHIAHFFDRGNGQLANNLSRAYYATYGKAPGTTAMSEALSVLTGYATERVPEEIALRVSGVGSDVLARIAIDMGDPGERVVLVGPEGWEVSDRSPVLFRRTRATMPYPEPSPPGTGSIDGLRDLLNVSDADFDLIVVWLLGTLIPEIQHPVMMLNGEHGTGKSDATRMLAMLVDPNVAPLRKRPGDARDWSVAAGASWVIALENMSWIEPWLSDDICTAVTGVGDIERQYHTNDDIRIRKIKRAILINGIDPGGVRGDLADRMFAIRLHRITRRLSEIELERKFSELRGVLFGGLLDLLVEVRKVQLSGAHWIDTNERMHDFALLCRAVDIVRGTETYAHFIGLRTDGLAEVTEDDPMTAAIIEFLVGVKGEWEGTPAALWTLLNSYQTERAPAGWPKTAKGMSQAFTRLMPGWRDLGIEVDRRKSHGVRYVRVWRVTT